MIGVRFIFDVIQWNDGETNRKIWFQGILIDYYLILYKLKLKNQYNMVRELNFLKWYL